MIQANSMKETIERAGYTCVAAGVREKTVTALAKAITSVQAFAASETRHRNGSVFGARNLLENVPEVAELARSPDLRSLAEPVLGANCFAVRGLLFDKTPQANWKVNWHQDLTIAVRERIEAAGFRAWSVKAGVVHVQPPIAILAQMLTLRLHLDDCGDSNGPLEVLPGSHQNGRLSAEEIAVCRAACPSVSLPVARGGVILMRPLLLHASRAANAPGHRRVIHLEYAALELPFGLQWHSRC